MERALFILAAVCFWGAALIAVAMAWAFGVWQGIGATLALALLAFFVADEKRCDRDNTERQKRL